MIGISMDSTPAPTGKGGARPGAGRKPGSANTRLAQQAREAAQATGLLPHEILLSMARGEIQKQAKAIDQETGEVTYEYITLDIEQRRDAAKAAAPYYAPKISTVEVIHGVNDEQLDELIAQLAAETGLATGASREGSEDEGEGSEGRSTTARAGRRRID